MLGRHLVLEQIQVMYPSGYIGRAGGSKRTRIRSRIEEGITIDGSSSSEEDEGNASETSTEMEPRPHLAIRITDPEGNRIPALPSGTYNTVTARHAKALALAKIVTLRGVATPQAFDLLIPYMTVHTVLYRVRGYSGPLPRTRVVVPIPGPAPRQHQSASVTLPNTRWSLGSAWCDTLVLLIPRSNMGAAFVLHPNMHREVVMIFTAQEVTMSSLGFYSSSPAPTTTEPAPPTLGSLSSSPTPSPYTSAPSSPVPWARPPAAPFLHTAGPSTSHTSVASTSFTGIASTSTPPSTGSQPVPPLGPLRHLVQSIARAIGQTRFVLVGLELLDLTWLGFPPGMFVAPEDLHRNVVHAVMHQAWRGDWYGPADDMERSVGEKIEFITHEQYGNRVGREQYLLETRL